MKKILLLLLFTYVSNQFCYGQTRLKIDYTPKSPEVSSLFNFKDVSVGNYTGSANINIPITSISSGPLSTSVSLSYNSSSHKVSERATWVGLGWDLNAGGIIAREVRGIPDDSRYGIGFLKFINSYNSVGEIFTMDDAPKYALYDDLSSYRCKDAEPDIFSFSVGGLSGKFMFDWDGSIKVACNRKIKEPIPIFFPNSFEIDSWLIIDDLGNKYTFSKKEINDITNVLGLAAGACNNRPYTASWKLTKIEDPSGNHNINFTYEDYFLEHPVEYSKQYSLNNFTGAYVSSSVSQSGFEVNGSYLKTITTNNSQNQIVFFTDLQNPRIDVNGTNLYPLGAVELKNSQNETVNKYLFDYTLSNRLKLDKIRKISGSSTIDFYEFEYNNTPLPNYSSYSKDHWGYYNGANNNVPYPPYHFNNLNNTIVSMSGANRSPNASYAIAGVLEKIIYPTKGYSKFTYENHQYSFVQSQQTSPMYEQVPVIEATSTLGISMPPNTWVTNEEFFDVSILNNSIDDISNTFNGKRKVNISVNARNLYPFAATVNSPRYFIYDSNNNLIKSLSNIPGPNTIDYCNGSTFQENDVVWLSEGTYKLVTTAKALVTACYDLTNFITVSASYVNDINVPINIRDTGGVRIKEIANYDHNDTLLTQKNYSYLLNDNPNLSSGVIQALPKYEDTYKYMYIETGGGGYSNGCTTVIGEEIVRYSGSLNQLGHLPHIGYKEVTISQTDGDEVIKTVYEYQSANDNISYLKPYRPAIPVPFLKGLLLKETAFKYNNGSFIPVKEITNEYDFKYHSIDALKVGREINNNCQCGSSCPPQSSLYNEASYKNRIGYNQLVNTKIRTSFNLSFLEEETENIYNNDLNRIISSSNKIYQNETILKEFTYPDTDTSSPINTEMINKNIISVPIKVEVSKEGTLLSTEYTKYRNWSSGIIAPEFIQSAIGQVSMDNPLENRLIHHSYNNLGNPTEISKADGTHIVYIWGYNKQYPIAKIENVTYSEIQGFVSNLQTLSNLDTDRTFGYNGSEGALRHALDNLRNESSLSKAMVSTYTYDPLIGVTSMTNPNGYTTYYEYDTFNRLKHVKDAEGNILNKNDYNYATQN